ncbi:MAG: GNAT family N-acetyltransferase [Ardenticatenaceae bacterium]|nr:GNAT family N-acetyltransferase [Anaerolineales bacterium]MCB8921982.1 GNAT family N-acetyltransferase [Ardenticatenaceae bacterium]MCB8989558.1 GNAT family N-acetyltransferase [Ardenticatenaceae bacterium]MCB9003101.1 GNAT family N-acetyltransferase [Ardenticatenaceae bacterium]
MMHELTPPDFAKTRPLFTPLSHCLTIDAILTGTTTGRVWVDDVRVPETAVCWANHRVYAGGRERPQLAAFFADTFVPIAQADGREGVTLHLPPDWHSDVADFFPQTYPAQRPRFYFRQDARQREWPLTVPPDVALRPVDAALLADPSITNLDYVTEEMLSERPSIAAFLANSFGRCLVHENKIVGWCMSEYNTGPRCELGIETAVPFRRRGLATLMATGTIRHALAQGVYDIGWLCWADNTPSIATAKKLGFHQTAYDEAVYSVSFNPAVALGVRGNGHLLAGRYAQALADYQQAMQQATVPGWVFWNTAVTHLKLNQPQDAFAYLRQAIAAGFNDRAFMLNSPHWQPYHDTEEWTAVLQTLDEQEQ